MGLKVTIEGDDLDIYAESMAKRHRYQEEVRDSVTKEMTPNKTKVEFLLEKILGYIAGEHQAYVVGKNDSSRLAVIAQAQEFNKGLVGAIR